MARYCMTVQSYFHKSQENTVQECNIKPILPSRPLNIRFISLTTPHVLFSPTLAKMLHCSRSYYLTKALHSSAGKARQEFT